MLNKVRRRLRHARIVFGAIVALICAEISGAQRPSVPNGMKVGSEVVTRVNGARMSYWPFRSSLSPGEVIKQFAAAHRTNVVVISNAPAGVLRASAIRGSHHESITVAPSPDVGSRGEISWLELRGPFRLPRTPLSWPPRSLVVRSVETVEGNVTTRVWTLSAPTADAQFLRNLIGRAESASWIVAGRDERSAWLVRGVETLGMTVHGVAPRVTAIVISISPNREVSR